MNVTLDLSRLLAEGKGNRAEFDTLGASPLSFRLGGLLMLALALGLWKFNRRPEAVIA